MGNKLSTNRQHETETVAVVAMDFGSTYSSYAFSLRHNPLRIFANTTWAGGCDRLVSQKTPTCVLLTVNQEFDSFGYEAEEKYAELAEANPHSDWYFFRRFKMMLYDTSSITVETMLPDISGKELQAVEIFAHSIRYLKEHFQSKLKKERGETVDQIQYVLTVPAIWDDKAKIFMRQAAVKAGIPGEHLRIALESEAASLWCQIYARESQVNISRKFIVVDIGGGTADITVQEQNEEGKLTELHQASGGPWGDNTVDENLNDLLSRIFGEDALKELKAHNMDDYFSMLRSFEISKRNLNMKKRITVRIPLTMFGPKESSKWENNKEAAIKIQDLYINTKIDAAGLTGKCISISGKLKINTSIVRDMFRYAIHSLVRHLKSLFDQDIISGVETILLVGGFAECSIVQDGLSEAFPDKKVITPPDCGLAVVKGAVMFGRSPGLIAVRKSKYFYGICSSCAFDPSKHPESKKVFMYDSYVCPVIFTEIVALGEDLPHGKEFSMNGGAFGVAQTDADVILYATKSSNTSFVDEAGCIKIGQIRIKFPESKTIKNKACTVYLSFWDTEIKFRVEIKGSKEVHEKTFEQL